MVACLGHLRVPTLVLCQLNVKSDTPIRTVFKYEADISANVPHDEVVDYLNGANEHLYTKHLAPSNVVDVTFQIGDQTDTVGMLTHIKSIVEPSQEEYAAMIGYTDDELEERGARIFKHTELEPDVLMRLFSIGLEGKDKLH